MYAQVTRFSIHGRDSNALRALLVLALLLLPTLLVALPSQPPVPDAGLPRFAPPGTPVGIEAPHRPPRADTPAPRSTGDAAFSAKAPGSDPAGTFAVLDASAGMLDLAASTGNATAAYEWVGKRVAWTPSWGLRKSPTTTFHTREGNAFDQAQLLADLLRLQGTPAIVTVGTIRVPLSDLQKWTGVEHVDTVLRALRENGVPATRDGDRVTMEHAWVQAKIDGSWVALDPSFKLKRPVGALNLTSGLAETNANHWFRNLTVSEAGYLPAYVGPLMLWGVLEHARKTQPGWTVGDALGIVRWNFTLRPTVAPPYEVLGIHSQASAFPESAVASVRIEGPGFAREWPTWWLADRRVTLVGEPATAADRAASQGRIDGKPTAIVSVVSVLKIDGDPVAFGPKRTEWEHIRLNVTFDEDRGADVARTTLSAGGHYAFAFQTGRASPSDTLRRAEETAYLAGVFWQEQSTVAREAILSGLFDSAARASFNELTPLHLTAWLERVLVVPSPSAVVVGLDWGLDGAALESAASGEAIQFLLLRDVVGAYHRFGERSLELSFRHAWGDRIENALLRMFPLGSVATPAIVLLASHADRLTPIPPRITPTLVVSSGGGKRSSSFPIDYTDPRARAFQDAGFTVMQSRAWAERGLVAYFATSPDGLSWGAIVGHSPGRYVSRAPSVIAFGLCDICSSAFDIGSSVSDFGSNAPSPSKAKGGDCKKYGPPEPPRDIFGKEFGKEIVKDVVSDIVDSGIDAAKDKVGLEDADWESGVEGALEGDGGEGLTDAARNHAMNEAYGKATGGAKDAAMGGDGNAPKGHGEATFDAATGVTDAVSGALGAVPWAMPYTIAKGFIRETTRTWDYVNDQLGRLASTLDGDCDDDDDDDDDDKKKKKRKGPGKDHPDDNLIVGEADLLYTGLLASYAREAEIAQASEFGILVSTREALLRYESPLNASYPDAARAKAAAIRELVEADVRINEVPRVLLLENGYWPQMRALLGNEGIAVRIVSPPDAFETLVAEHPVLVIPSGGLAGLEAPVFRARLDAYARAGGRIVAFSQAYGEDFSALPGSPSAYGWNEDISCRFGGSYAPSSHPALAGLDLGNPGVNIDGFFLSLPQGATTLLARSATGQAAAATWKVGNGTVLASALFPDYAAGIGLASAQDLALPRSMVLWALHPDANQTIAGASYDLAVNVENRGERASAFANVTIVGPGGRAAHLGRTPLVLAPGANRTIVVQWRTVADLPGMWTVDALLTDAAGVGIVRDLEVGALAVHAGQRETGRDKAVDVAVTGEQNPEYGSRFPFTVHLWEREGVDRDVTVRANLPRTSGITDFDWFAPRRVFLPAFGHLELNYSHDPVLKSDRVDVVATYDGGESEGRLTFFTEQDTVGSMRIDANEREVRPGGVVPIYANLTSEPRGIVNVTLLVRAPGGAETRFYRSVRADERGSVRERFEYALGANPSSETYVIRGNASTPKRSLAIAYEQFTGPRPALELSIRPPGEIRVGGAPAETVFTLQNRGVAPATGVLNVTGSTWSNLPGFSRTITVPAGGTLDVPYRFNATRASDVFLSWVYTQDRLVKRGYFEIEANLTLKLETDKPRYAPGSTAVVTARLENRGPFRFPFEIEVQPTDIDGEFRKTGLSTAPGEDTTASFSFVVPASTPNGAFSVYGTARNGSDYVASGWTQIFTLPFVVASATSRNVVQGGTFGVTLESLVAEPLALDARTILLSVDGREISNTTTPIALAPLGTASHNVRLPAVLATGPHALRVGFRVNGVETLQFLDVLNVTGTPASFSYPEIRTTTGHETAASVQVAYGSAVPAGSTLELTAIAGRDPSWVQTSRKIDILLVAGGYYASTAPSAAGGWIAALAEAGHDVNITIVPVVDEISQSGFVGRRTFEPVTLGRSGGSDVQLSQYENPAGSWAPASTRLIATHPWRAGAERILFVHASGLTFDIPFSFEPVVVTDEERTLDEELRDAASAADVRVFGYAFDVWGGSPVASALEVASPGSVLDNPRDLVERIAPGAQTRDGDDRPVVARVVVPAGTSPVALPPLSGAASYNLEGRLLAPSGDLLHAANATLAVERAGRRITMEPTSDGYSWRLNITEPAWAGSRHRLTVFASAYEQDDDAVTFDSSGRGTYRFTPYGSHLVFLMEDAYLGSFSPPPRWFILRDAFPGVLLSANDAEGPPPLRVEFYGSAGRTPAMTPARLLSPVAGEWMILLPLSGSPSPTPPIAFEGGRQDLRWILLGAEDRSRADVEVPNPVTLAASGELVSATASRATVELKNGGPASLTGPLTVTIPSIGTYSRSVTVGAGATRTETFNLPAPPIAGTYAVRARFEPTNRPVSETTGVLDASSRIEVLARPEDAVLAPGENRTVALRVRNSGFLPAYATLALDVGSIARDSATSLLAPGETATLRLDVDADVDAPRGNFTGRIDENGVSRAIRVRILGPAAKLLASDLDKEEYRAGDTAKIHVAYRNSGELGANLTLRASYQGVASQTRQFVPPEGVVHANLTVPIGAPGLRLAYSVRADHGGNLLVDALRVHAPPAAFSIRTDRETVPAGVTFEVRVRTPAPMEVVLSDAWGNTGVVDTQPVAGTDYSAGTWVSRAPFDALAGTYVLRAEAGGARTTGTIDVAGGEVFFKRTSLRRDSLEVVVKASEAGEGVLRLGGATAGSWDVAWDAGDTSLVREARGIPGAAYRASLYARDAGGNLTLIETRVGLASTEGAVVEPAPHDEEDEPSEEGEERTFSASVFVPTRTQAKLLVGGRVVALANATPGLQTLTFRAGPFPAGVHEAVIEAGEASIRLPFTVVPGPATYLVNGTARQATDGRWIFEVETFGELPERVFVTLNGVQHPLAKVGTRGEATLWRSEPVAAVAPFTYSFGASGTVRGDTGAHTASVAATAPPGDLLGFAGVPTWAWVAGGIVGLGAIGAAAWVVIRLRR